MIEDICFSGVHEPYTYLRSSIPRKMYINKIKENQS
jgi:hypothetical protein